ncbi:hypothetical protein AGABI1DRAFT_65411 [Agaricus bisporus var. burnettii JB137-S8]|uniref:CCAAT-binding factor domain-containing protein n=1 Tax=Agaricus bisporus var. burnettii (strain JB137-S8 / ATCC MYA-4627 / FGSC 10392) TaxID=597362 RepID=K5XJN2_AGABU|nr:uncharacterized protein AGABI1DRAFT_65411 [Agaricus bisporus var. burnettii JB137-S8]EKM74690.1 hypothetical protein AGABI1DRAFT_65411 [Agaricus bisporus var. burnettii JB137-S8]
MAGKGGGGRDESLKSLRCIVDWWVGGGAPDRKLRYFRDQSLSHPQVSDEYLMVWYFEDWLKKYFFSVLQILETLSLDPLPYVRTQAVSLIFTLLKAKPEQEQNLLRLLVNKLGDSSKSLCSRVSYHLLQLLQAHPSMKSIVVREIISLILKPSAPAAQPPKNQHVRFSSPEPATKSKPQVKKTRNAHAQYYATITFNQIVLTPTPSDREVAIRLIDIYFELFKDVLGSELEKMEDDDEKLIEKDGEVQKDKKGRVLVKNKGKEKKSKEISGAAGFIEVEDSDSKLISALLTGVNRALPFAKVETGDTKINSHLNTLFLITHKSTFNISIQALVLIQQISLTLSKTASTSAKPIVDRYFRTLYESLHDHRLGTSSKQAMYLNLLYKSIKADPGQFTERQKALIKRFVQVLASGGSGATEFMAGGLYLLGELFSTIPGLRSMIFDVEKSDKEGEKYDPRKRDPLYAHAGNSPIWELIPLLHHYHPTISLLARQLLTAQPLTATADLSQNTLSHFLDRFVYKNPKKKASGVEGKGASAMQPAGSAIEGVKLRKGEMPDVQVNQPAFWKKKETQIPVDQMFFYTYFKRKEEIERKNKKKREKGDEDEESDVEDAEEDEDEVSEQEGERKEGEEGEQVEVEVEEEGEDDSDIEEEEIWKAMKATMPKAGDDEDLLSGSDSDIDEDDDLPSDFSAAMANDEDENLLQEESDNENEERSEVGDTQAEEDDDEDGLSLVEDSDNEDLVPLDEMPDGLIAYDGSNDGTEEEEWGGINTETTQKRKRGPEEKSNSRRKRLRSLPTFASYEDYAKMIEDGPEDDI